MTVTSNDAVRCSSWARAESLDPIGTAGCYDGFLLVETPLPWPRDVGQIPDLAALGPLTAGRNLRIQALVPHDPHGPRQVVLHSRPAGTTRFEGFRRQAASVGGDLGETVAALLDAAAGPDAKNDSGERDVLVCTHGRRDVCCGSAGTELSLALGRSGTGGEATLWRTSHTGGHRFAPTFIVLPEGTAWAFADADLVGRVLERSVAFRDLAAHYRGCSGLGSPRVQAVERAVLSEVGWELMDRGRQGYETGEESASGSVVTLEAADAHGGVDRWEAVVRPGRTLPVPDCMKPLSEAKKSETELVVTGLRHL